MKNVRYASDVVKELEARLAHLEFKACGGTMSMAEGFEDEDFMASKYASRRSARFSRRAAGDSIDLGVGGLKKALQDFEENITKALKIVDKQVEALDTDDEIMMDEDEGNPAIRKIHSYQRSLMTDAGLPGGDLADGLTKIEDCLKLMAELEGTVNKVLSKFKGKKS